MSLAANIEENVIRGLVLNDQGEWIPLSEKVRKENDFLSHLEAGEVLCNGKWMKIAEAIKLQKAMENQITEEMPVHYQDVIDNARTRAYMIKSNATRNVGNQENYTDFLPETVCIEAVSSNENLPETVLYESIPDSDQNTNSVSSPSESVNCSMIDSNSQHSAEIQNVISNINELISRKNDNTQEKLEEDLINQALSLEDEPQHKKNRSLLILFIILGVVVCSSTAIILYLLQ
jgi:hypothetical protein